MRDVIEDALRGPSVLEDESKLGFEFVPEELPHRDEQMRQLTVAMRSVLTSGAAQTLLIRGPVGSGKTALSKRFTMEFRRIAKERDVALERVHVNCRRRSTTPAALLQIINHFDPAFPDRGFSTTEMLEQLSKQLQRRQTHLIVVLDEVDVLVKKAGSDLIYHLTRFNEEGQLGPYGVSLILVSQEDVRLYMDEGTRSTFKQTNTLKLESYSAEALASIVEQRIRLAFHPNTVDDGVVDLISDIGAERGDARFSIELLHKAGLAADEARSSEVLPEHVRAAKAHIHPFVTDERLAELDVKRALVLLALARVLQRGGAYAKTGDVESAYQAVCEEYDQRARGHTQFWTYIQDLDALGLMEAKRSGKGVVGTTTLMSLPDVPASVLEARLRELLDARL
ncbi:MAG: AAA family ATPase [Candidatus Thermoplasmatota archaeon]|nr:AAA family ATPase [Candidatus Thermoplasmatota archaeon]